VAPLFCSRWLRPHDERDRFPPWLFAAALLAAVCGLAYWSLGHLLPADWTAGKFWIRSLRVAIGAMLVGGILVVVAVIFWIAPAFDRLYEWCAERYERGLRYCLGRRLAVLVLVLLCLVPCFLAFRFIGEELFPEVDAGEFTVHLRASGGPNVKETERRVAQ